MLHKQSIRAGRWRSSANSPPSPLRALPGLRGMWQPSIAQHNDELAPTVAFMDGAKSQRTNHGGALQRGQKSMTRQHRQHTMGTCWLWCSLHHSQERSTAQSGAWCPSSR
jgi:hypothetical protein